MADALLAPAVAATMYVASGTAAGISIHKLKKEDDPAKLPTMAVTAALVFAGYYHEWFLPALILCYCAVPLLHGLLHADRSEVRRGALLLALNSTGSVTN